MRPTLLAFCAVALLASCRDKTVTSYRVPKEAPSPAAAGLANIATGAPAIHWQKPAGWQEQPLDGVRVGSFLVSGADGTKADLSVTTFPGDVGGDLANVNRWRGQLSLGPIDNDTLAQTVQTIDAPAGKILLVDLAGAAKKPARLLGAWLKQPGRTWFFKLMGDDALVSAQRDAFVAFLQSVTIDAAPAGAPLAAPTQAQSTNDLPKNTGAPFASGVMPDTGAAPSSSTAALTWSAPADWSAKPLGSMRLGSFTVRNPAGADADVSIIAFPGEAGGLLANLNRWRGQLGLAPIAEGDLADATTTLDGTGGLHFTVVDFAGQSGGAPARLLGAIVPFGDKTYFFKMTGPDASVAHAKTVFLDFLKTVKAP
ncbi:MAG TPA: hypothetical protein VK785_09190 [Opitutaceae bacterium]|nr:hypothetical protein [Opitutaceae bacterium]